MIHHIFANKSNAGDWLSALGIQRLLGLSGVQEHFCDDVFLDETFAKLAAASSDDFILIGGGGLFMDYFIPFWRRFLQIGERVPFCLWGVGLCDMKLQSSRAPSELIQELASRARLCVVRDSMTREFLALPSVPGPVPCPTFAALDASPSRGLHRLLHVDHYDNVGSNIYEQMVRIAEQFAEDTGRTYRQTNNLVPADHRGALRTVIELYASADVVLTSRLHGCIIALATGRPVLAVSGDRKIESFMSSAGLEEWVLGLDQIDRLPEKLRELPFQEFPAEFVRNARKANGEVADQVRELISASVVNPL